MGKIFLPKETHGAWDAGARILTVYVGEEVLIGFQGTQAELDNVAFSAWGNGTGECATEVFREGLGKLSTKVQTRQPGTLTFEATDGERPLAPSFSIKIRMRPDYRHMAAEGQQDETACWAASLAWWLRVQADRPPVSQATLVNKLGVGLWNKSTGTMNPAGLQTLVTRNNYRMRCTTASPGKIRDFMGFFPMLIGFTAAAGFAHMNVICGYDPRTDTVDLMEPMFPDPVGNSEYEQMETEAGVPLFYNKTSGLPAVYTGTIRTGVKLNSLSPMKGTGTFWIGYPQEYAATM
jgi:hypothetical protein